MEDLSKERRWAVRAGSGGRGSLCSRAGAFAAAVFVAASLALGAWKAPEKIVLKPSYAIPNIVAVVMCLSVLAIACKRFKRTV